MDLKEQILAFINAEYASQQIQVSENWQLPLERRIAKGEAISHITEAKLIDHGIALKCPDNYSRFVLGDRVILDYGNPQAYPKFHAELDSEQDDWLNFLISSYGNNINRFFKIDGLVIDRDFVDLRDILFLAMDQAFEDQSIIDLITGQVQPEMIQYRYDSILDQLSDFQLNEQQRIAIQNAYATRNYYAIQGPPGTGKTYVLAILAALFAREGKRVFITAFSHHAINNALLKVIKFFDKGRVFKVGNENKSPELTGILDNFEYFNDSGFNPNDNGFITGGTCLALHTKRLKDVQFDVVIFDEAGQLTLPLALAGMTAANKYIFIGDHKQMPPVFSSEVENNLLKKSIFEIMTDYHPGTMLDVTYRMNRHINDFPSRTFYNGLLQSDKSCVDRLLNINSISKNGFSEVLDPQYANVFCEVQHQQLRQGWSPEEADFIARLVKELFAGGIKENELAIIAPFRAQARLIKNYLLEQRVDFGNLIIDTVEKTQGWECDVVILSLTSSDAEYLKYIANFYYLPNRFNVIITRCRSKRIIVGDRRVFINSDKPKIREWVEVFKGYFESAKVVNVK